MVEVFSLLTDQDSHQMPDTRCQIPDARSFISLSFRVILFGLLSNPSDFPPHHSIIFSPCSPCSPCEIL